MVEWKMQTMDLMKVLSDPRRNAILHLAKRPITVKELAEEMDEKPSRLYYHINKLLDVELLEIVETKQQGNLVENYYKAINVDDIIYKGDIQMQAENLPLALSLIRRSLDPALRLYEKGLEKVKEEAEKGNVTLQRNPYHVSINSMEQPDDGKRMARLFRAMMKVVLNKEKRENEPWPEFDYGQLEPEEEKESGTYEYIIISYRTEDAIKLGLIESDTIPEKEEKNKVLN